MKKLRQSIIYKKCCILLSIFLIPCSYSPSVALKDPKITLIKESIIKTIDYFYWISKLSLLGAASITLRYLGERQPDVAPVIDYQSTQNQINGRLFTTYLTQYPQQKWTYVSDVFPDYIEIINQKLYLKPETKKLIIALRDIDLWGVQKGDIGVLWKNPSSYDHSWVSGTNTQFLEQGVSLSNNSWLFSYKLCRSFGGIRKAR